MNPKERELAHVPRWCIVRTIRQQSVAEHSFFVARYAIDICRAMGIPAKSSLIEYCLKHDDEELHTGDIPAPYKKNLAKVNKVPDYLENTLSEEEKMVAKAADMLEAILFLVDEELMGNKTVGMVLNDLCEELENYTKPYRTMNGEFLCRWLWLRIDAHRSYRGRVK